jgi:uncharacterized membrane protein
VRARHGKVRKEKILSYRQNNASQPDTNYSQRLSITVGIVLLGLVSSLIIKLPTQELTLHLFGSPLSLYLSTQYVVVALLVGLTCTGTDALIRTHPLARRKQLERTFIMWTVPALTVLIADLVLAHAPSRLVWVGSLILTGILLSLTMTAEYHTIDPQDAKFGSSQVFLSIMIYALALAIFVFVYGMKSRSLLSATTLLVVTTLLALERLRVTGRDLSTIGSYALFSGMIVGESVWALNYSQVPAAMGGLLLLLSFHLLTGLAQQHLIGRLTSRIIVEYGLVTLIGFGLTIFYFL